MSTNHVYEQFFYTTLGALKLSKDKFQELVEDLIQNQPYAEDEGKRIYIECLAQLELTKNNIIHIVQQQFENTKSSIQTPVQNKMDTIIKEWKQKIQDYSIQQLLSTKN